MILTGDVNLMNVTDPAVPFSVVENEFRETDIVFSNLECCLYRPPGGHPIEQEGFYADPVVGGRVLRSAGIHAVGVANNVTVLSIRQTLTPDSLQGRVAATNRFVAMGIAPVGALAGGFLGSAVGLRSTVLITAIGLSSALVPLALLVA